MRTARSARTSRTSWVSLRPGALAVAAFLLAACENVGSIDLTGTGWKNSVLRVEVVNATASELTITSRFGTERAAAGVSFATGFSYRSPETLPTSEAFEVRPGTGPATRVSFRPLHYPPQGTSYKNTRIILRESSPGQFVPSLEEADWVEVLSVTQIP